MKPQKNKLLFLLMIVIVIMVHGCASVNYTRSSYSYSHDQVQKSEETATIWIDNRVKVLEIDDQQSHYGSSFRDDGQYYAVIIKPGKHTFKVRLKYDFSTGKMHISRSSAPKDLDLNALAGKSIMIKIILSESQKRFNYVVTDEEPKNLRIKRYLIPSKTVRTNLDTLTGWDKNIVLGMGALFSGGDNLYKALGTDYLKGPRGGEGAILYLGGEFSPVESKWKFQLTGGYLIDRSSGEDIGTSEDPLFKGYKIELYSFYEYHRKFRIGGGLNYYFSSKFTDPLNNSTVEFKNSLGPFFQLDYKMGGSLWAGLRYGIVSFTPDKLNGNPISNAESLNGTNIGFYMYSSF